MLRSFGTAFLFLVLTYALSILVLGGYYVLEGPAQEQGLSYLSTIYMFMPMLAGTIVLLGFREAVGPGLGVALRINSWLLIAWLSPLAIALCAIAVGLYLPGTFYSPDLEGYIERYEIPHEQAQLVRSEALHAKIHPFWFELARSLLLGATVFAAFALGEETGWRGVMQRGLEKPLGMFFASLLVGFFWGLWHAPLILHGHAFPHHPYTGVGMMIAVCMLLAPLLAYLSARAQTVIAAAIFHGVFSASGDISIMMVAGGSELSLGLTGLSGLAALGVANLLMISHDLILSGRPIFFRRRLEEPLPYGEISVGEPYRG